jgi:hypothetical protein
MQTRVSHYPGSLYGQDWFVQEFRSGKWEITAILKEKPTMSTLKTEGQDLDDGLNHDSLKAAPLVGQSGSHSKHSRLSPSSAKQWTNCTASIAYIKSVEDRLPKDDSSEYSREGTQAHDYATELLHNRMEIDEVPESFRQHVEAYCDHCLGLAPEGTPLYIESKVALPYMAGETGTVDFAAVSEDRIWIRDLKYGIGKLVVSEENPQMAIYAMGLIRELQDDGIYNFDVATLVDIMAHMPRHRLAENDKPWVPTLKELEDFYAVIESKAELILSASKKFAERENPQPDDVPDYEALGLEFAPADGVCDWCRARAICPARINALASAFDSPECNGVDFLSFLPDLTKEEEKLPVEERIATRLGVAAENVGIVGEDVDNFITDDRLVAIFASSPGLKGLIGDVEEYLQQRADMGQPAPGTKLVMGREGNRDWNDPEAVDKLLAPKIKADRFKKELISPAQAEKLLEKVFGGKMPKWGARFKNLFTGYISRSPAQKKIALASDKRDAVQPALAALPDLDAEENEGV